MAKLTLDEFLDETNDGRIFSVQFIKRTDNALRPMACRRGVTKGVTGVGMKFDPAEYALAVVYDMNKVKNPEQPQDKGAFRMINLETILSVKLHGLTYYWDEAAQCLKTADHVD